MASRDYDLSIITRAQASEIQAAPLEGSAITTDTEDGELLTMWSCEDDGSLNIERVSRAIDKPPEIISYAYISFDNQGDITSYTGSYIKGEPSKKRCLRKPQLEPAERDELNETVRSLVEFVFMRLDD